MTDHLSALSTLVSKAGGLTERLETKCASHPTLAARYKQTAATQVEVIQQSLANAKSGRISGDRALADASAAISALESLEGEIDGTLGAHTGPADKGLDHVPAAAPGVKRKGMRSVLKKVRGAIHFKQGVLGDRSADGSGETQIAEPEPDGSGEMQITELEPDGSGEMQIAELEAREAVSLRTRNMRESSPSGTGPVEAVQSEGRVAEIPRGEEVAERAQSAGDSELDGFRWDFSLNGPVEVCKDAEARKDAEVRKDVEVRKDEPAMYRITRPVPMWL